MAELAKYALSVDIDKIMAAYRLRTNFMDTHMPKARMILLVLLGAGVLGLSAVAGEKAIAEFIGRPANVQPSSGGHEEVARSLAEPSAHPMVLHTPSVEKGKKTAIATHIATTSQSKRHNKPEDAEASSKKPYQADDGVGSLINALPLVTRVPESPVTPASQIAQPDPTPTVSPEPSPPTNAVSDPIRP